MAEVAADLQIRIDATTELLQRQLREADRLTAGFERTTNAATSAVTAAYERMGTRSAQAVTRLNAANENASRTTGRLSQAVGQAGFQLQDFVVQVQSGTSALTALSQQGSQFLGVFGPAGAIAGVVLAIGAMAAQLLLAKDATEELSAAQKQLVQDLQKLEDLGDTEAEAQERRIQRNREEAQSVYARAKAELTAYEDRLVRERRDASLIADTLRADARAGLKDAPDLLREQEQRIVATDAVLERVRARLSGVEEDFDRTLTRVGRNALEKTLEWASETAKTVSDENAKAIDRQETQNEAFRQREQRAAIDALIVRLNEEERERERAAERAFNTADRERQRQMDQVIRDGERVVEQMQRTISDVLFDGLTGKLGSFWKTFEALGMRAVANILSQVLTTNIAAPIAQAVLGTGAAAGVGGAVNSYLFGTGAVGAFGPQIPTAGLLGSGGTLFGSASLASAALPVAGIAAALILPSLLGGKGRGDPYTQGNIALGADGRLSGYAAGDNGADPSGTQREIDQAIAQLQGLASGRGLQFTRGADLFGDRTGRTLQTAIDEVASGLRPGASTGGATAAVLNSGQVTGVESLNALLGRADQFDTLSAALRGVFDVTNEAEQQFTVLAAQLAEARKFADEFGLSLDSVTAEMAGDFNEQVRRSILSITDADALALEDQERTAQARLDLARELGADINRVEELNGLERSQIVERQLEAQRRAQEAAAREQERLAEEQRRAQEAAAREQERLAEEQRRAQEAQIQAQREAERRQLEAVQAWREQLAGIADRMIQEAGRLRQEVDAALLGQYSPLSPTDRLALAQQRFASGQLGLDGYLAEGSSFYGTATGAYSDLFYGALQQQRDRASSIEAAAASLVSSMPGFATGGSFDVVGRSGNDNLVVPMARFTAGEVVNVSRRDTMSDLVTLTRDMLGELRRQTGVAVGAGEGTIGRLAALERRFAAVEAVSRRETAA